MAETPPQQVRLNKFIAQHLNIGRRQADTLIEHKKVRVNNKHPSLGAQITIGTDLVIVNGKPLVSHQGAFLYIALHKPKGYVCSRRPQGITPTIYELLPEQYQHLKSVGRLDKDSSGLLLLTNDGNFAHRLTHPRFAKVKQYEVKLNTSLASLHHQIVQDYGISLPDGFSRLQLERLHEGDDTSWLVTMYEGRNRQIRRTFAALDYTVTKLKRITFGSFTLAQLKSGEWKELNLSATNAERADSAPPTLQPNHQTNPIKA